MNHPVPPISQKSRLNRRLFNVQLLAFFGVLALLVCNAAARLAGGLAGSLALAAAAVLRAVAQVTRFDCLNMFHG